MTARHRTAEARKLLADIRAWTDDTGTPETVIGHVLFLHPGFVGLLRLRETLSEEKEDVVRRFLKSYPDGWHGPLPKTHANGTKPNIQRWEKAHPHLVGEAREACFFCGVRPGVPCRHRETPQ